MIAIVDYGMGNVRSLSNAITWLGHDAVITADPGEFAKAARLILPGVGAFGDAVDAIRAMGLDEVLEREVREKGKPLLGICLGMQLLARSSEEHGAHSGLGWFDAEVRRFSLPVGYKIPHIGWSAIRYEDESPLFRGLHPFERHFYFVHSFHVQCQDPSQVLATAEYAGPFTAAVRKDNVVATQFHPEKSQDNGIKVLGNFLEWEP